MPPLTTPIVLGLTLVFGLVILVVIFEARQWRDRRLRGTVVDAEDDRFYRRQDRRRAFGSVMMLAMAAGMARGLTINPRFNQRHAQLFVLVWLVVLVLAGLLMVLAVFDWFATRGFAQRHRTDLILAARALAEAERRRQADPRPAHPVRGDANGRLDSPEPAEPGA